LIVYQQEKFRQAVDSAPLPAKGVFTTLRLYQGQPVDLAAHHQRLADHARAVGLGPAPSAEHLLGIIGELVALNDLSGTDSRLRLSLGPAARGQADLALVPGPLPTDLDRWQQDGVPVICLGAACRRTHQPHLKTFEGLTPAKALESATTRCCPEALILDDKQHLLEGLFSNVFLVSNGRPSTPPASAPILAGRTRQLILELAETEELGATEGQLGPTDLQRASEIFLVNCVREVVPVISVDGTPVGTGRPGPVTRLCQDLYRRHIRALARCR